MLLGTVLLASTPVFAQAQALLEEAEASQAQDTESGESLSCVRCEAPLAQYGYAPDSNSGTDALVPMAGTHDEVVDKIAEALRDLDERVNLFAYGIHSDDVADYYQDAINNNPELWYAEPFFYIYTYMGDDTVVELGLEYVTDEPTIRAKQAKYRAALDDMLSWVPWNAPKAEQVKAVHDWLVRNVAYNTRAAADDDYPISIDDNPWSAYGALVNKSAVCQGYTLAFAAAMKELGITYAHAYTDDHMWTRVLLDGVWYHVDVTGDDPLVNRRDQGFDVTPATRYFLKSDAGLRASDPSSGGLHPSWYPSNPVCPDGTYDSVSQWNTYSGPWDGPAPAPISIEDASLTPLARATYTGFELKPVVTLVYDGRTLTRDVDFEVAFSDNTNAGSAKAMITGLGAFSGSYDVPFTIDPADIGSATIHVPAQVHTGDALMPEPTVTWKRTALTPGTDYDVSYANNTDIGQGLCTVTGKGNFTGSASASFDIVAEQGDPVDPVNPRQPASWRGLEGLGRYETMAAIVHEGFPSSDWAVIAYGQNFPDALVASSLAGLRGCPVILTEGGGLSEQARSELKRLHVTNAYIVGGTGVISAATESSVKALGVKCTRVAGADRQETSLRALDALVAGGSTPTTVVVATGMKFADALAIGPWCYSRVAPIMLTARDNKLSDAQVRAIKGVPSIKDVLIVGGKGAVSDEVIRQLGGSYTYRRLAGNDRYLTCVEIAAFEMVDGMSVAMPGVATGNNYPDALAGAALCGKNNSVMLLAYDGVSGGRVALTEVLAPRGTEVEQGYFFGGNSAVPHDIRSYCVSVTQ